MGVAVIASFFQLPPFAIALAWPRPLSYRHMHGAASGSFFQETAHHTYALIMAIFFRSPAVPNFHPSYRAPLPKQQTSATINIYLFTLR